MKNERKNPFEPHNKPCTVTAIITILGDASGDGRVGTVDLSMLGKAWDTREEDPVNELLGTVWNENCDFNGDTKIGTSDLSIMGRYWGTS